MKSYLQIYTLFLMFIVCTSCKGQNKADSPKENIKSETQNATASHGPTRITRNLIQDRKGNIWIASWEGIFKYDGKSFANMTSKVSSARFFSVLEDRKGNLWFGSIGSGVYCYDGKSFINFTTKNGLAGNDVTCIYEDRTGNIWFGTGSGASCYNGKSFRNFKMKEGPLPNNADSIHVSAYQHKLPEVHWMHNDVNAIIEDKTGKFWFGTRGYARIYDGKTFTVVTHKDTPFTNVRSIIKDKKGNIWLGGNDGLWRYDGSTFTNFTRKFVGYILEDKKGNIWISSERDNSKGPAFSADGGRLFSNEAWALYRYDGNSLSGNKPAVKEITSKPGMIFGILEAKDGSIWFGAGDGVCRYDGISIKHFNSIPKAVKFAP